jgi:hypothetical protein
MVKGATTRSAASSRGSAGSANREYRLESRRSEVPARLSFCYLVLRQGLQLLTLRVRSDDIKDLEILGLRHELAILRRRAARPEMKPIDRLFLTVASRLVGLESPIVALIRALGNVRGSQHPTYADARMKELLHALLQLAVLSARLCARRRASGYRRESPPQAATALRSARSSAGAEPHAERSGALCRRVALPHAPTHRRRGRFIPERFEGRRAETKNGRPQPREIEQLRCFLSVKLTDVPAGPCLSLKCLVEELRPALPARFHLGSSRGGAKSFDGGPIRRGRRRAAECRRDTCRRPSRVGCGRRRPGLLAPR